MVHRDEKIPPLFSQKPPQNRQIPKTVHPEKSRHRHHILIILALTTHNIKQPMTNKRKIISILLLLSSAAALNAQSQVKVEETT